jgi:chromosome segregation ATPase
MKRITPQEYAELKKISISTVYRNINSLKTEKEGRKTYILVENEENEKKEERTEEVNKIKNKEEKNIDISNENEKLKLEKEMYLEQIKELKKDKDNLNNQLAMSQSNIQNLSKSFQQLEYKKEETEKKKWWEKIFS